MDFSRRLKLYLVGFLFGCTAVYFMLIRNRDRDFSWWFPGKRVISELKEKKISFSANAQCELACFKLTEDEARTIITTGEVNFTKSKGNKKPCAIYAVEGTLHEKKVRFMINDCENEATAYQLTDLYQRITCACN